MNTLKNWQTKANGGTLAGTDTYSPDIIALQAKNKELKKQLKIAQLQKDAAQAEARQWRLGG